MKIFEKIKVLFAVNSAITNLKEAKVNSYLSTEFVSKVVLQLLIIVGACYNFIPPQYALLAVTSLTALYMILRQIYKIKNPTGTAIPELPVIAGLPTEVTTTTKVSTPSA